MKRDWRGLFDAAHIPWRDRGKNTSRGNVNTNCPWCGDDDGYHLSVSEFKDAFYCWRRPGHGGSNLIRLLVKLGVPRGQVPTLLNIYRDRSYVEPERVNAPIAAVTKNWDRFFPAIESDRCLDYLWSRGFDDPEGTADRYGLRYAKIGPWAMRLLIPISDGDQVVSWIGRAMRASLEPKYYVLPGSPDGLTYLPRPARRHMIAVEGSIDALKGAAATEDMDVSFVAMLGKNMNSDRVFRIKRDCAVAETLSVCFDSSGDVTLGDYGRTINEIDAALRSVYVKRLRVPEPFKDVGEMPFSVIRGWAL